MVLFVVLDRAIYPSAYTVRRRPEEWGTLCYKWRLFDLTSSPARIGVQEQAGISLKSTLQARTVEFVNPL